MKEPNWQHLHPVSGIYEIICNALDAHYIGRSVNINRRWIKHREDLKANKHHSVYLQRAWNKHGSANFEFKIVEQTPPEQLKERELHYLKTIPGAFNMMICNPENDSALYPSPASREKMSEGQRAYWQRRRREGKGNMPQHQKDAISAARKGTKATDEARAILRAAFKNRKHPPKWTHCKRGHPLTPDNHAGKNGCRICDRERKRRWELKQRQLKGTQWRKINNNLKKLFP